VSVGKGDVFVKDSNYKVVPYRVIKAWGEWRFSSIYSQTQFKMKVGGQLSSFKYNQQDAKLYNIL
jgi:hypothetical protein